MLFTSSLHTNHCQYIHILAYANRKGKRDLLLPYVPPVILNVDIPNKRVDVEILEGLDDED